MKKMKLIFSKINNNNSKLYVLKNDEGKELLSLSKDLKIDGTDIFKNIYEPNLGDILKVQIVEDKNSITKDEFYIYEQVKSLFDTINKSVLETKTNEEKKD